MLNDYIPSEIHATKSEDPYWCEMCHKTAYITVLSYPITKNFEGGRLSQVRREIWMCDECREKVIKALVGDGNE